MSQGEIIRFSCAACGKSFAWKPELAGKKAKCKCGKIIQVPKGAPKEAEDDLYDLAPGDGPLPPVSFSSSAAPVTPAAAAAPVPRVASATAYPGPVLGYKQGPAQRERDRFSTENLMDMTRDVHAPVAFMLAGFALYIGYYMFRFSMPASGVAIVSMGLGIMMAVKAALLIGFALMVAGPLGVSFGGIWTAVLKLAAVAIFSDGCTTWVDYGVDRMTGVGGGFGIMISFPIALGIYWLMLTYLFSMDAGDSWLVVILLAVFSMIVRWALLILLMSTILSWGGVAAPALAFGGGGGGAPVPTGPHAELIQYVNDSKEDGSLWEAREFIAGGREEAAKQHVDDWYAAGCPNVWYDVGRTVEGKPQAMGLIVEMPKDKSARARCYQIKADYFSTMGWTVDPSDTVDDGAPYLSMGLNINW
jgi:hypothetical protein